MELIIRPYTLALKLPFTIARGSRNEVPVVFVELHHEGIVGIGEASPLMRYGENVQTVMHFLARTRLEDFDNPFEIDRILGYVDGIAKGNNAAKAAVDIALHDWVGKKLGLPLHRHFGPGGAKTPYSSYTISIDTPDNIARMIDDASGFPILKVKLGLGNDEEVMNTVREYTMKIVRVDANEGWTSRELALERLQWLADLGVEFVEQPMPADRIADAVWLHERSPLPLIADESVKRLEDIASLPDAFDGINIKLMKCSGIREALRMIDAARALHMKVMLGCMIESSVGISAAAQLANRVDYADLDGALLISNDPYEGVTLPDGIPELPDRPGIGVKERQA